MTSSIVTLVCTVCQRDSLQVVASPDDMKSIEVTEVMGQCKTCGFKTPHRYHTHKDA